MASYSELPPKERAAKYRSLAAEAEAMATKSKEPVRGSYLRMAVQWRRLAAEADTEAGKK